MFKYSYEKVQYKFNSRGALAGNSYAISDYQEIIDKKGSEGWRYAGFIPTLQRGTGYIEEMVLVFEKEE